MHQFVIWEASFPANPILAIQNGFAKAEEKFTQMNFRSSGIIDKSGSCAIVILIVGEMCYVANVGDSRAVLSLERGIWVSPMSIDHKPTEESESQRIIDAGGQIY